MKKEVIIGIFLVLFLGLISATPYILFVNPTPSNNAQTTGSSLVINSTIENMTNMQEFVFNWAGTNYSLYDESLILMLNLNNNSQLGENDSLVYDSSRGGHNGTVTGASFISSGKYAGAYNFTGGQGINISASSDFNVDEFTISVWVKLRKKRVISFDTGQWHTCFIDENNDLFCVGYNKEGQLGDNSVINRDSPVKLISNYNFTQVVLGQKHTCSLIENGSAMCWGDNGGYQLGDGGTTDSSVPQFVSGNHNFTTLFSGGYNTCGVLENLSVYCWGTGTSGQFGDGTSAQGTVPRVLAPDFNFTMLAPGEVHMCGILNNGSLYCWGANNEGQLGVGNTTNLNYPHHISGNHNFSWIDSGEDQTCGVLTNGSALCWGENEEGNLGFGTENLTTMYVPTFVNTNFLFSKIWLAKHYACGNLTNGSFACWGEGNQEGVYGDGTTEMSLTPKIVDWNIQFDSLYDSLFNSDHLCGLKNSIPYCWGTNYYGQSGIGTTEFIKAPTKFSFNGNETFYPNKIAIGTSSNCMIDGKGYLYCRGDDAAVGNLGINSTRSSYIPKKVFGDYNFSKIELSNAHSCGLLHNGSILCWGSNTYGQIGDGTSENRYIPIYIGGENSFESVYLSAVFTCGILQNGSALCWGRNNYGQLGMGNNTQMYNPQFVVGGYNFSKISVGRLHVCGILQNGSALCWGRNNYGQLGLGVSNTTTMYFPTYVLGGKIFDEISIGEYHSCGILQNGSALCWGRNNYGQLGDNSITQKEYPRFVYGNKNFSKIQVGKEHSCGILQNSSLMCWGSNGYWELGDLNKNSSYSSLVPIFSAKGITFDIYDSYPLKNGNCFFNGTKIYCWGYNYFGILGDNTLPSLVPAELYLGDILGKSDDSFKIGATMNASIRAFVSQRWLDMPADEGWNHITFVYNSSKSILYLNGEKQVEHNETLMLFPQDIDIKIGSNITGETDEIMMWNRTLSDAEINQVYLSSLQQRNHTAWEFYSTQTLPSVGTYSYSLFALDNTGSFTILRRIIKYIVTSSDESESVGGSPSITVKESKLQEGQVRQLRAGTKVKLEFSGQGTKILEVVSVNEGSVEVEIEGVEVEIVNGTTEKIDVNDDGFYDLEVSVQDISSTGSARLMFKEIYEEIKGEVEEGVEEEVKEESDEGEELVEEEGKRVWFYFVIGGILLIGFIVFFVLWKKKR